MFKRLIETLRQRNDFAEKISAYEYDAFLFAPGTYIGYGSDWSNFKESIAQNYQSSFQF